MSFFCPLCSWREKRRDSQGFEGGPDIDFWATGNANVQIVLAHDNEMLDKVEDLFSRRWHPSIVRAFIESIDDEENRALIRKREHIIQTFHQGTIIGCLGTLVVFRMKFREKVETKI